MVHTLRKRDWFHADGFPIAVERREPQAPFGLHAHEFAEIVLVTGGGGMHVTAQESWRLSAGDVFVIGGPQPHAYQNLDDLRLINVLYDPEHLQLEQQDLPAVPGYHALFTLEPAWRGRRQFRSRLHLGPADLGAATGFVDQLDEELGGRAAGFGFVATALFMQLVAHLSRCFGHSTHPDSRALLRIAKVLSHLETHYDEPLHLDELARMAHMSPRNFLRTFQTATGRSPIAHLIQLRINRAEELLRRDEASITDIAFRVGFSDSNYFTRQFRKLVGVSPRAYRRRHGQGG
jgi:AraC family L-rhamnose operon transcriptional activator RhaR/AraC family L-rhamnose operon regulatory protein RhaS